MLVTYLINPLFLTPQGVKDLLLNATIVMILAAGQTLLIITRNIDLSVGSMLGLVAFGTGSIFAADARHADLRGVRRSAWPSAPCWARSTASW